MTQLRTLFRLINWVVRAPYAETLGIEPPSDLDRQMLESHPARVAIERLAEEIIRNNADTIRGDTHAYAFVVLYAEVLRQTGTEQLRVQHPYPAAMVLLRNATSAPEEHDNPWLALDAIRGAIKHQCELDERVDDLGCSLGSGTAVAAHRDFMKKV